MNIFEEIKSRVSAREIAENYGLKVNKNNMACCPFHDDRHPSMKIDKTHFHCFGCGAHGDAIGYVAELFGIGQFEAAVKINDDFSLGIDINHKQTYEEKAAIRKKNADMKKIADIRDKLHRWKNMTRDSLLDCEEIIKEAERSMMNESPHVVFLTNGFVYMMHVKSIISYWLDILCMGSEEEIKELFLVDGKEVSRVAANVKRAGDDILGRARRQVG